MYRKTRGPQTSVRGVSKIQISTVFQEIPSQMNHHPMPVALAPAEISPLLYEDMETMFDFFQLADSRQAILNSILNQNYFDDTMTDAEKQEFRDSLQTFAVQADWCCDHHYNYGKVLRRIPLKLYKALHSNRGALQLTSLVTSMEAAYQNESLMIDLCR